MSVARFEHVRDWKSKLESRGWWHSFELPDGRRIEGVCGAQDLRARIEAQAVPKDLHGARVLDIGAWDGWFSFEMERRGAEVLAIDCWDNPRFRQMRALLNSQVDYRVMDVYEVSPETVGRFDIVLFMGVLYHLKHPLLALEKICAVTTEMAAVDSFVLREEHRPGSSVETRPVMEFYETDEFGGQTDNWCGPSLPCLMAMCRTAGFARVEHRATLADGAALSCWRKWRPVASPGPRTELKAAFHHTNFGLNFDSKRDEYISAQFRIEGIGPTLDDVKPQVDEFGIRGIRVEEKGAGVWQVNFRLPPGLEPGWHQVSVRSGDGPPSNPLRIAVDLRPAPGVLRVVGVSDGATWAPDMVDLSRGRVLVLWVEGLPENADRANTRVTVGGEVAPVAHIREGQINVDVPAGIPAGSFSVEVEIAGVRSNLAPVRLAGEREESQNFGPLGTGSL